MLLYDYHRSGLKIAFSPPYLGFCLCCSNCKIKMGSLRRSGTLLYCIPDPGPEEKVLGLGLGFEEIIARVTRNNNLIRSSYEK